MNLMEDNRSNRITRRGCRWNRDWPALSHTLTIVATKSKTKLLYGYSRRTVIFTEQDPACSVLMPSLEREHTLLLLMYERQILKTESSHK